MAKFSERVLIKPDRIPKSTSNYCLGLSRVAALGHMSSSIMHDIGNALTVISGNSQIIQFKKDNQTIDQVQTRIETILGQLDRIQNMMDRVGSFGSRLVGGSENIDPAYHLNNALFAFSRRCSLAGIECNSNIIEGGSHIFYDPSLFEYIVLEFLSLFIKTPIEGSKLKIDATTKENAYNIEAWLEFKNLKHPIFDLWDDPKLEITLLASMLGLDKCGGEARLFKGSDRVGWRLSIPRNVNEEEGE